MQASFFLVFLPLCFFLFLPLLTGAPAPRTVGTMTTPPPQSSSRDLDLGQGFRFFFEDPDWVKKILIGGVFMLLSSLIIGAIFVAGYGVHVLRRVVRGEPRPLPEWEQLGLFFNDGLRAFGLYLLHLVAVGILPGALGCLIGLMGGGLASMSHGSRGASDAAGGLIALLIVALYAVTFLLMMILMIYFPAAFTRFAVLDRFAAGFEVAENIAFIRRNLGRYALALVLYLLASFVAQVGIIACCVGLFPASFWAFCVGAWAMGEVARRDPLLFPALSR